jgi:cytosine/adenosine deaminase-related metal-dependent hydrolase
MQARRLAAGWLIPVHGPPIPDGALLIGADGRIVAVGPDAQVPRPADISAERFDQAVILPGFINTHTHLELTGFEGRISARDFPGWIRSLRELKATRSPAEYVEAARRGLADCFAAGVTTIADTGDSAAGFTALVQADGSGVAYQEVFGPHPGQAEESLAGLQARVDTLRARATSRVRIGASPHAPYTVSGRLYRAVSAWAAREDLPLAVHVGESSEESELLARGTGPFAEAWRARGIPLPTPQGYSPIRWLGEHGVLSERTLCIHAVHVDDSDIAMLAETGASVAHCPLSNRVHSHGDAPLGQLLARGIVVGLGTDSVVSVGRLDLLAEARAAAVLVPQLSAELLIELCTLGGARALGLEAETGSLRPGKWADCAVIQIPDSRNRSPAQQVVGSSPQDVLRTYLAGKEVYRSL